MQHTVETLADALYEGKPTLANLAETLARQYGKADALSFFAMMGPDVQFFWTDIARQIIKHSKEWQKNSGSCCVLSEKETARLRAIRLKSQGREFTRMDEIIQLAGRIDALIKEGLDSEETMGVAILLSEIIEQIKPKD